MVYKVLPLLLVFHSSWPSHQTAVDIQAPEKISPSIRGHRSRFSHAPIIELRHLMGLGEKIVSPIITPRRACAAEGLITPRRACAAEGLSDCSWTGIYRLYIVSAKKFSKLKKYSLSEVHFNTGRLLFQFNGLQYSL